jgi:hypothetical protein
VMTMRLFYKIIYPTEENNICYVQPQQEPPPPELDD